MLYSLKGILVCTEPGVAVIECGGVGFKCSTTMSTLRTLPPLGEEAKLYTYMGVREDAIDLFGFASLSELNCFKTLISVSGVGPKVGLSILSELSPERLAVCISAGDFKSLTRASGVGPKLAQRIVLELRDKVTKLSADSGIPIGFSSAAGAVPSASAHAQEAIGALSVLGYTPSEAASVISKLDSSLPTEELIRLALKEMGSKF